jgi:hypothetical protein
MPTAVVFLVSYLMLALAIALGSIESHRDDSRCD